MKAIIGLVVGNIISMNKFDENFFKEEVRCGFTIDLEMKRVWAAEMKILSYIIDVCKRYDIQYYADYGTLLGAIRHGGFIPWDDDIDISLKRADYMKLLSALKQENNRDYIINSCYDNNDRRKVFTSISNYASVPLPYEIYEKFYQCPYVVGIDVYVLDYVPRDKELASLQRAMYTAVYDLANRLDKIKEDGEFEHYLLKIEEMCNVNLTRDDTIRGQLWRLADSIASMFTEEESDMLVCMSEYVSGYPNLVFDKTWFERTVYKRFEYMDIAVPYEYDKVLTQEYGDYMIIKQNAASHEYPFFKEQKAFLEKIHIN